MFSFEQERQEVPGGGVSVRSREVMRAHAEPEEGDGNQQWQQQQMQLQVQQQQQQQKQQLQWNQQLQQQQLEQQQQQQQKHQEQLQQFSLLTSSTEPFLPTPNALFYPPSNQTPQALQTSQRHTQQQHPGSTTHLSPPPSNTPSALADSPSFSHVSPPPSYYDPANPSLPSHTAHNRFANPHSSAYASDPTASPQDSLPRMHTNPLHYRRPYNTHLPRRPPRPVPPQSRNALAASAAGAGGGGFASARLGNASGQAGAFTSRSTFTVDF
ncbi:unnamed protein product [Closterium sp. NIES-54]